MARKILPILLLAFTYLIDQSYTFFQGEYYEAMGNVNWVLDGKHAMPVAWNVKYLSDNIVWALAVFALYLIAKHPTKINKLVALEYFLYRCLDIIFYFYNFKTERYWFVFVILGTIIAVIYLKRNAKTTNEKAVNTR